MELHLEQEGDHGKVLAGTHMVDLLAHLVQTVVDNVELLVEIREVVEESLVVPVEVVEKVVNHEDLRPSNLRVSNLYCHHATEAVGYLELGMVVVQVSGFQSVVDHMRCLDPTEGMVHKIQAGMVDG